MSRPPDDARTRLARFAPRWLREELEPITHRWPSVTDRLLVTFVLALCTTGASVLTAAALVIAQHAFGFAPAHVTSAAIAFVAIGTVAALIANRKRYAATIADLKRAAAATDSSSANAPTPLARAASTWRLVALASAAVYLALLALLLASLSR